MIFTWFDVLLFIESVECSACPFVKLPADLLDVLKLVPMRALIFNNHPLDFTQEIEII